MSASLTEIAHQLLVLEMTYPAWTITRRRNGMWSAIRVVDPTLTQTRAGLHKYMMQPTMQALAAVLAAQLDIAQRTRS